MDRYAYYPCNTCGKAYFGGEVRLVSPALSYSVLFKVDLFYSQDVTSWQRLRLTLSLIPKTLSAVVAVIFHRLKLNKNYKLIY